MTELCRGLPNRRWNPRDRTWSAPAIRANADYIRRSLTILNARITQRAQEKLDELLTAQRERHQRGNFPTTYEFNGPQPMKHQRAALDALYGLHAMALYMDMGTGKTKIVIDIHGALSIDKDVKRVLLFCPLSVRRNWERELALHMAKRVMYSTHRLDTSKAGQRRVDEWVRSNVAIGDVQMWLIIGTESLAASKTAFEIAERFLLTSTRTAIIVDEAHMIKNADAHRTKQAIKLARRAEWRTIMTGTPIAKGPLDLYAQFEFLDPDIIGLGDWYSFRNRYAVMGGYEDKEIIGYQHIDELTEVVAPFVYQVRKDDVLDLPPKVYVVREVELTEEQRRLYTTMKKHKMVTTGERSLIVQNALERTLRLQEITGGFVSYENNDIPILSGRQSKTRRVPIDGRNPKIDEVLAIAAESSQSTIVWCAFTDEIKAVAAALRHVGHRVVELYGEVEEEERMRALDAFQRGDARFLVGNAATGGLGLNMTTATLEVYYSNTFRFVDRMQSEDRAHRKGQTRAVTIIDLVARDTVDDNTILPSMLQKRDVSEFVRNAIDAASEERLYGNA